MKFRKLLAIITAATMLFSSAFAGGDEVLVGKVETFEIITNEIENLEGDFNGGSYTDGFGVTAYDGETHKVVVKDISVKVDDENSNFYSGVLFEATVNSGTDMTVTSGKVTADITGKDVAVAGVEMNAENGASLSGNNGNITVKADGVQVTAYGIVGDYYESSDNEVVTGSISVDVKADNFLQAFGVKEDMYGSDITLRTGSVAVKAQGGEATVLGVVAEVIGDAAAADITVEGNVTADATADRASIYGIGATGNGEASVQVTGNVSVTANLAEGEVAGIYIPEASGETIAVSAGDVNVKATSDGYVEVVGVDAEGANGAVTTGSITVTGKSAIGDDYVNGIYAANGATVFADGDVTVSGTAEYGIGMYGGGIVEVNGDVSVSGKGKESAAITVKSSSDEINGVRVTGDVNGRVDLSAGAGIAPASLDGDREPVNPDANIHIAIEGTLVVDGEEAAITVHMNTYTENVEEIAKSLPDIIVYEIDADKLVDVKVADRPIYLDLDDGDDDGNGDIAGQINDIMASAIRYIIRNKQGVEISGASGSYYGMDNTEYKTATTQDTLIVNAGKGATGVKAGKFAKVTKNADGTYTVTVMDGGDLNIVVTFTLPAADCGLFEGEEVEFGAFDFDGDGEAEPIKWKVFRIYNTTVALKLAEGQNEEIADFIENAFTEEELTALYAKDDAPYIEWSRENGGVFANILINVDKVGMLKKV